MDVIYIIEDLLSGLKYIGSKKNWGGEDTYWGSLSCQSERLKKYKLQEEWRKHFDEHKETFKFKILEKHENLDYVSLLKREKFYQKKYNVLKDDSFVNACLAGGVGFMGAGENNPMYGKKHSEESKEKMRIKQTETGKRYSKERKGVSKEEYLGREKADIFKKKMSNLAKKRIGEKNPFYGKKHSKESKEKMSKKLKGIKPPNIKKIYIEGEIFEGLQNAEQHIGVKSTTIWYRIHSKNVKFKNYYYV
jgi:group I intron endonuclease